MSASAMACFHFLHNGYDAEVIYGSDIHMRSGIDTTLFLILLVDIVVCDLYFDSHILFVLIITLILIIHVLIVLVWESIMHIPSPITSHFSSCCCESTLSLCTPISNLLICYWTDTPSYSCCLSM